MPKEYWIPLFLVPALLVSGLIISRAEESCLLAPNAPSPEGAHWYYRTQANSQKKCWHLRTDGQIDERSVRQSEQPVISDAAAIPPLPRPAPETLRQHSGGAPTGQAPTRAPVGIVNEAVQNSSPSNAIVAWPPPPPPDANTNVFGDSPTGTIVATAPPSSTSTDNIMAPPSGQPHTADEDKVAQEIAPADEPNVRPIQQQPTSDDVKLEKDIAVPSNKDSYKAISLAMLIIIAASFILVGIGLNRTLVRVRKAAMVDAALPVQADNTQTSEGPLRELREILQYEPKKVRRAAAS